MRTDQKKKKVSETMSHMQAILKKNKMLSFTKENRQNERLCPVHKLI